MMVEPGQARNNEAIRSAIMFLKEREELVRCGNCRHNSRNKDGGDEDWCLLFGYADVGQEEYCSYGERSR